MLIRLSSPELVPKVISKVGDLPIINHATMCAIIRNTGSIIKAVAEGDFYAISIKIAIRENLNLGYIVGIITPLSILDDDDFVISDTLPLEM